MRIVNLSPILIVREGKRLLLTMGQSTLASGRLTKDTDMELKNGRMELCMKVIGKMIWLMEKVRFCTFTVINMKATGSVTKLMEKENIPTAMVPNMMENGKMTSSMVSVQSPGTIILNIKANTQKAKSMESELTPGRMALNILVNGMKIESMARESTPGTMVDSTKEIGSITIWMVMGVIFGKTAVNTKVNTKTIRNTGKVHILGLMVVNMKVCGKMVGNMGVVNTSQNRDFQEKASGIMARGRSG